MYPGQHAHARADQPAVVMAGSGETVSYRELEARSNRLAHLLRAAGLRRLDHYAIFMENHPRFVECCAAGERSGLYYTCVNSFLTAPELAYIVNNSLSKVLITSQAKRDVALAALSDCPRVELCLIVDGPGEGTRARNLGDATADCPATPISDESLGAAMLYSSGTTGRPKGVLRPLPNRPPAEPLSALAARLNVWRFREGQIYLSPAPLYHSAPLAGVGGTIRRGGTAVVMERFDEQRFLALVEQYRVTHTQLVPTMFSRMLKLPEAVRRALRSLVARGRNPRRGALSDPGQAGDDRLVGADYPRILQRDRSDGHDALRQRRMARPSRHRRQVGVRRASCSGRRHAGGSAA